MKVLASIGTLLLLPSFAFAAGFAKQSLFLSQSTVLAGQTVFIYAVIEDDSVTSFSGALHFSDETGPIGRVPVYLEPGKATTVSVSWKPGAGSHTVTAALKSPEGDIVESEDATFVVSDATASREATSSAAFSMSKKVAPRDLTATDSSAPIVNTISRVSPPLATKSQPYFDSIDNHRKSYVIDLVQKAEEAKKNIATSATAAPSIVNTVWLMWNTLVLYFCTAFAYLLSSIGVFYPALLFMSVLIIWKILSFFR